MMPGSDISKKTRTGELRHVRDFDLPYAFANLTVKKVAGSQVSWRARRWANALLGALAVGLGWAMVVGFRAGVMARDPTALEALLFTLVGSLSLLAWLQFAWGAVTPGRLVLDRDSRELRFYRFWFSRSAHRRLSFADIDELSHKDYVGNGNAEDSGHAYDILIAELRDGRQASIAIDSPYDIEVEIRKAIGLPETEALKRKRHDGQRLQYRRRQLNSRA